MTSCKRLQVLSKIKKKYAIIKVNERIAMKGLKLEFALDEKSKTEYEQNVCRDVFLARMEAQGLQLVEPEPNEIQIDLDTDEDYQEFIHRKEKLESMTGLSFPMEVNPSKSGLPKRHVTITAIGAMDDWQRVAMQMAFNSDPMREFLTVVRLLQGEQRPILFFERRVKLLD
jgi:hypothetical protein